LDCPCSKAAWALKYSEQAVGYFTLQRIKKMGKMDKGQDKGTPNPRMRQDRTDYGLQGESGEKIPKSAKASDEGGERRGRVVNGIGLGMKDNTMREKDVGKFEGDVGEANEGRTEGTFYRHGKEAYPNSVMAGEKLTKDNER